MKKNLFLILVVASIVFSSCNRYTYQTINSITPSYSNISDTVKTELIINKKNKIEGTAIYRSFLIFTLQKPSNFAENDVVSYKKDIISRLKSAAVWDAVNTNNVEMLINPRFSVIVKNTLFSKYYAVKVDGYGANTKLK
jgi:hypothetical protein